MTITPWCSIERPGLLARETRTRKFVTRVQVMLNSAAIAHHGHDQNKRHEAEGNDQKENAAPAGRIDKRDAGGRTNDNGKSRSSSPRFPARGCVPLCPDGPTPVSPIRGASRQN